MSNVKKALITGITGQDGSYLAEHLLEHGYEVHGVMRRSSNIPTVRIDHIFDQLHLYYADVDDAIRMVDVITQIRPDEIYHLAAQSHVSVSFDNARYTMDSIIHSTQTILDAVRISNLDCKVYHASSSEMFGDSPPAQSEETPLVPCSPYGCAKVCAHNKCRIYRDSYGIFICGGILFNHESPRRGHNFVTQKVVEGAVRIKKGLQKELRLGNLSAERDWGYAKEYVIGMHTMMQADTPDNFVIATGESHSVEEFVASVFSCLDMSWKDHVVIDSSYIRPKEVNVLCGDASKIEHTLGWRPKVHFSEIVEIMVEDAMRRIVVS